MQKGGHLRRFLFSIHGFLLCCRTSPAGFSDGLNDDKAYSSAS